LFSLLRSENLYDDALIIVTSDHGESFGEYHNNGRVWIEWHSRIPYESQIRVPLIIKFPDALSLEPRRIKEDVSVLDIAPTILALLDLESNADMRGHNLLEYFDETSRTTSPLLLSESPYGKSVRGTGGKYIRRGDGQEEFYNLTDDPDETRNLAPLRPEKMKELKGRYDEITSEQRQTTISIQELEKLASPAVREQLKTLGYIE
jgi:arylsulfatase A-like enzyme